MSHASIERSLLIPPAILTVLALIALFTWGLKPGIDLAGGSLLEVSYAEGRPDVEMVREALTAFPIDGIRVQPAGEANFILKQRDLTPAEKEGLVEVLGTLGTVKEERFTSIGPALGQELRQKSLIAMSLVVLCIILFITFAFRHVSKPVASWKYALITIVTLAHDVILPMGLFAYLGYAHGAEVDSLFIVGLLTILGISINDTIVVFDRVRENLLLNEKGHHHRAFSEVVWTSIKQTLTRSINTSLTVIVVLLALYFFGPDSTRDFSLMLTVGMVAGTYSSILLAAPLLVVWEKWSRKV